MVTMAYQHIQGGLQDGVLTVVFDRPDVLNSFNARMADEVAAALREARENPSVRAVLITGNGRAFCAGQDLSEVLPREGVSPDLGDVVERQYSPIIRGIRTLEKPVVCAVNGVAAGAGANIAFACDLVVAARSASFVQAFSKIGLLPDSGGTFFLPRLVGSARAMGLALLGEKLSAEDAARWGLIWKVVDDAQLMAEALAISQNLSDGPTKGYGLIKKALAMSATNTLDAQLDLERDLQRQAGFTEDYREGVAAFKEKRKPAFKGK